MYAVAPFLALPIHPHDPAYAVRVPAQERAQSGLEGLGMLWQMAHVFRRRSFKYTYRGSFRYTGLISKSPNIFGPLIFNGREKAEVLKALEEELELFNKVKNSEKNLNGFVNTGEGNKQAKGKQNKQAWKRFVPFLSLLKISA